MTAEERTIQRDRMRFIKNSLSSNLAILGILFNVFYFVSIYKSDVDTYYYNILIGASIVYNLVFMLAVFLSSEGVKNYKRNYSYLLAAIGALQIGRIFIIPMGPTPPPRWWAARPWWSCRTDSLSGCWSISSRPRRACSRRRW